MTWLSKIPTAEEQLGSLHRYSGFCDGLFEPSHRQKFYAFKFRPGVVHSHPPAELRKTNGHRRLSVVILLSLKARKRRHRRQIQKEILLQYGKKAGLVHGTSQRRVSDERQEQHLPHLVKSRSSTALGNL